MSEPKILFFDLETSPLLVATFSLFKPIISIPQIREHARILCWSAMWYGTKKVLFDSEYHNSYIAMLEGIRDLLDEADIVVGYNSNSFDIKWLNAQLRQNGIDLPSPYQKVDLYRLNKGNFYLPSGKLDYVAQRMLDESKVTHSGIQMWMDICWGDESAKAKAWTTMKKYAMQDTKLLPALFEVLRPFITNVNFGLWSDESIACTHCGSSSLQKRGPARTTAGVFQRYQCQDCGGWSRSSKRIDTTELRPMSN